MCIRDMFIYSGIIYRCTYILSGQTGNLFNFWIFFNAYRLIMCRYVRKGPGASGGQRGVSAPVELELQAS